MKMKEKEDHRVTQKKTSGLLLLIENEELGPGLSNTAEKPIMIMKFNTHQ